MASVRPRRLDLDRAKGLAILLVVLGHIVAGEPPRDNQWYLIFKYGLYEFHMAFFMYLSGYVTFLSGAARVARTDWPGFVSKRAKRLLPPFFIFWVVIVAGKLIASHFIFVDNMPASVFDAAKNFVWHTDESAARTVWYLVVLFALAVIVPPLMWKTGNRTVPLLALGLVLYALPVPHVMWLDHVARFFIFFVLGGFASDSGERWLEFVDRFYLVALALLLFALYLTLYVYVDLTDDTKLFICGMLSIPAFHGLVRKTVLDRSTTLMTLGTYSMAIYLFNTPLIGLVKGVMLKLISWDGVNFLLYVPILIAAGTVVPVLIKRHILNHFPAADRMTT